MRKRKVRSTVNDILPILEKINGSKIGISGSSHNCPFYLFIYLFVFFVCMS